MFTRIDSILSNEKINPILYETVMSIGKKKKSTLGRQFDRQFDVKLTTYKAKRNRLFSVTLRRQL